MTLRLAVTPGEPAGVGPDLLIKRIQEPSPHELVAFDDPGLLEQRDAQLGLPLKLREPKDQPLPLSACDLSISPCKISKPSTSVSLNTSNAPYVL